MFKGEKVAIGPLLAADIATLFRWFNDVEAARQDLAYRPMDWIAYQGWVDGLSKDPTRVLFAIRRLDQAAVVGFVGITNINSVHRSAEIGVRIGEKADRDHGYGQDALRLALTYCWNHLNLNRVSLSALADNERAIRAFSRVGFEGEGLVRRAAFIDGRWHDIAIMGILRPELT